MKKNITMYELMGLIKDNKAPKKIKYDDKIFEWDGYNYKNDDGYFDYYLRGESNVSIPNLKVEILSKENDPDIYWEDIEEYYAGDGMAFNISAYEYKINQLIKNQKYLKERLESKDEKMGN